MTERQFQGRDSEVWCGLGSRTVPAPKLNGKADITVICSGCMSPDHHDQKTNTLRGEEQRITVKIANQNEVDRSDNVEPDPIIIYCPRAFRR